MDAIWALVNLEPVKEVFAHGDLGGHEVFWEGGRIPGVLHWDLSSRSDRSTDFGPDDVLLFIRGKAPVRDGDQGVSFQLRIGGVGAGPGHRRRR